jgi:hypothetical protein
MPTILFQRWRLRQATSVSFTCREISLTDDFMPLSKSNKACESWIAETWQIQIAVGQAKIYAGT